MGLLDKVERGIEKAVRGVFSTGSRAQVEPVEIASRLRTEVDNKAITIAAGRTLAPNVFDVLLSSDDFQRAQEWGTPLAEELCDVVINHVRSQGYTLQGPVRISFRRDEEHRAGQFRHHVADRESLRPFRPGPAGRSRQRTGGSDAPAGTAATRFGHRRPALLAERARRSSSGRSSEADILIDDTGVSRRHLEIRTGPGTAQAIDLGSTNGSYVNGQKIVGSSELTDGATIMMGRTKIIFRLLPANTGGRA